MAGVASNMSLTYENISLVKSTLFGTFFLCVSRSSFLKTILAYYFETSLKQDCRF